VLKEKLAALILQISIIGCVNLRLFITVVSLLQYDKTKSGLKRRQTGI